jgi:hypothetical protein
LSQFECVSAPGNCVDSVESTNDSKCSLNLSQEQKKRKKKPNSISQTIKIYENPLLLQFLSIRIDSSVNLSTSSNATSSGSASTASLCDVPTESQHLQSEFLSTLSLYGDIKSIFNST